MAATGDFQPFVDVRDISRLVGPTSLERGQHYANSGAVLETSWDPDLGLLTGLVRGSSVFPYAARIRFSPSGSSFELSSTCSCPLGGDCKHVAATLIRRNLLTVQERMAAQKPARPSGLEQRSDAAAHEAADPQGNPAQAAWKTTLDALTGRAGPPVASRGAPTPMGLLFELRELTRSRDRWRGPTASPAGDGARERSDLRLGVRPVIRSGPGNWVRKVNWSSFTYQTNRLGLDPEHQAWLAQLLALNRSTRETYGFTEADWLYLDDFASPLLWPLLATAADIGVALVSGKKGNSVTVGERATIAVEITAAGSAGDGPVELDLGRRPVPAGDLEFGPAVRIDGTRHPVVATGLVGDHGLYAWELTPAPHFVLAPTAEPVSDEQHRLLNNPERVTIPASDVAEFLGSYYPKLRRRVRVSSPDEAIELPAPTPPTLVLTATYSPEHVLRLTWDWQYEEGRAALALTVAGNDDFRDPVAEREVLARIEEAAPEYAPRAVASLTLEGFDAAEFTEKVLPVLRAVEGVRVDIVGEQPNYRELTEVPTLTLTTVETNQRDWFDLGVIVTVDGRKVPFGPIFAALSQGHKKLLLIDNSYLSLDQPVFDRLRTLIEEAGELTEWETGVRISRYQATLWEEFEDLADETEQALAWRESVAGLLAIASSGAIQPTPLPSALTATLRPYQQEGFDWLAFLWKHGLGGVLADDMGLGKTLQTLALVSHAVASAGSGDRGPFLVVAPTSVVSNWLIEAARFAPLLVVRGVTETEGKARASVASIAAGADLVITSYALFRIDFERYSAIQWGGLILDEAQFVKNPASRAHEAAVSLNAPFKLAITGTPMENSLTDLWSLFSIVAPGLFPSIRRFREDYVRPIAAGHGESELARLRRRIRPLMLRRTKEIVAADLPAKQEQVLAIDLTPKHRKLYDTFLQRERQKLLGLIDDLDKNRFIVFRSLTLLRMLSLDASLVDEKYADIPSAKLDALFEHLEDVVAEGHRALIFSQFTSFLGKAAARLTAEGIPFAYLDGSTTRRGEVISSFRDGDAPVFLISLKAGGFGLNLTEADYVFLLDPWWNPAAEEQAIDRTHRIGQTRSVNVYRMVASGTIEEKVMTLKAQKSKLFDAVIEDDGAFSGALTADEIRGLLEA